MGIHEEKGNIQPDLTEDPGILVLTDDDGEWKDCGLSVMSASYFFVAEITGAALVVVPYVIAFLGYLGILALMAIAGFCGYGSYMLGECWVLVFSGTEANYQLVRDPYPAIALKALGKFMRGTVILMICLQTLLIASIYFMLAAQIFDSFFHVHLISDNVDNNTRLWLFICLVVVTPLTWFDTPMTNSFVAILGAYSVYAGTIALIAVFCFFPAGSWYQIFRHNYFHSPSFTADNVFLSLGILMGCYSGTAILPTIQQDMKQPREFSGALGFNFLGSSTVYLLVSLGSAISLHGYLKPNLLVTLQNVQKVSTNPLGFQISSYIAVVFLLIHFLVGISIQCNPLLQQIETCTNIEEGFHWRRCFLRTLCMGIVFLFSLTLPEVFPLFCFLGASVNIFLTVVFPLAFYVALKEKPRMVTVVSHSIIILSSIALAVCIGYYNFAAVIRIMAIPQKIVTDNTTFIGIATPTF